MIQTGRYKVVFKNRVVTVRVVGFRFSQDGELEVVFTSSNGKKYWVLPEREFQNRVSEALGRTYVRA